MHHRLEMNNSGSWKLLGSYTPGTRAADRIRAAAADLVDALNDRASGRTAMCKVRVATDEPHPKALAYFQSREEGWRDA
jgi:hypothetical protein